MRVVWLAALVISCSYEAPLNPDGDLLPDQPVADAPTDSPPDGSSSGRVTSGLVALWTFSENGGATIADSSNLPTDPINLTIADRSMVTWAPELLTISQPADIRSAANTQLVPACKLTNEVTLEVWVAAANNTQMGANPAGQPTRIATLTVQNISSHLISIGQQAGSWVGQVQTSATPDVHGGPFLEAMGVVPNATTHLVLTSNATVRRLYVDGVAVDEDSNGGDLSSWAASFRLSLSADPGARNTWQGAFHLAAIYDRALDPAEVVTNFTAGP